MDAGMTFTIEPMITLGGAESSVWEDDWTVVTTDGSRCAQFEHTLVVTEKGRRDPHACSSGYGLGTILDCGRVGQAIAVSLFSEEEKLRKVRTPQSTVVGNAHPG